MADPSTQTAEDTIGRFVTDFASDSPTKKYQAVAHLALSLQAKDTIIADQNYRIAVLSCRQLLERIAQYILDVHAKRPESCKGKKINDLTQALKHLPACKAMDANLLQMILQFSGDAEEQTTAAALFAKTSNFIHNDMQTADQILVLPASLHSAEIHLMTGVAMYHRLDVKVITKEGEDVTEKHLSQAQRQVLKKRIDEAKNWLPKEELITARTPELADLFEAASLAREEDDAEE